MSEVVCARCGLQQVSGATHCAMCGSEFPTSGSFASYRGLGSAHESRTAMRGPDGGPQVSYATVGRRALATLIDLSVIGVIAGVVVVIGTLLAASTATQEPTNAVAVSMIAYGVAALITVCLWLGLCFWQGSSGATLGNRVMSVRVVDDRTFVATGFPRAVLWWLVQSACGIVAILSPLFGNDPQRRGLADRAAGTVVLDVRATAGERSAVGTGSHSPTAAMDPWAQPGSHPTLTTATSGGWPQPSGAPQGDPWSNSEGASGGGSHQPPGYVGGYAEPVPQYPVNDYFPEHSASGEDAWADAGAWSGLSSEVASGAPAPAEHSWAAPGSDSGVGLWADDPGLAAAAAHGAVVAEEVPRSHDVVHQLGLLLETGEWVPLTSPTLVGRNPQAPETEQWSLVALPDPTRSVSKTHLEVGVDGDGVWVRDRGSTNGTMVRVPGYAAQPVAPGVHVRVPVGATILLGDRQVLLREGAA